MSNTHFQTYFKIHFVVVKEGCSDGAKCALSSCAPYGDLTIISPTVIQNKPLSFKQNIDFHPSGNNSFKHSFLFSSEIRVGETIVKSPYACPYFSRLNPRAATVSLPLCCIHREGGREGLNRFSNCLTSNIWCLYNTVVSTYRHMAACQTMFGLSVPFWGEPPTMELSFRLSYPSSIQQV